ncbi:hypothetical protein [Chryseobacterium binzhouense]|uniref:hypothetical protein n=1 Tax=Chryseobacterium binzhouense TaxID=2593646 RepID=UPI00162A79E1|nr:hypothetical protein [Chryseobacterium binzhouense]
MPLQGSGSGVGFSAGQEEQSPPPLLVPPPGPAHHPLSMGASAMLLHCKLITTSQSLI